MPIFVRYARDGRTHFGEIEGEVIHQLAGAPWEAGQARVGITVRPGDAELLCPATPTKIIACGVTYEEHASEAGALLPQHQFASASGELIYGMRALSVLNGPNGAIVRPPIVERLDHEAELAVVIGRRAKHVSEQDAMDYVFGFTCYNDCGARDIQMRSPLLSQKAKSIDTFGCCGPWIVTDGVDIRSGRIDCRVNGETRQSATFAEMNRSIGAIIAEISRLVTLMPGDLIATGSPAGVSPMQVGDAVEVEIEGIGVLRNHVIAEVEP